MRVRSSDLTGVTCAVLALGLIAWLSLDSWAITRCDAFLASGGQGDAAALSPEQVKCLKRHGQLPQGEN